MADQKVFIEVDVDDQGARRKALDLDRQLDQLGATAGRSTTQGIDKMEAALRRATGTMQGAEQQARRLGINGPQGLARLSSGFQLLGATAVFAGVTAGIRSIVEAVDDLDTAAGKLDTTVEAMQRLQAVAVHFDSGLEDVTNAVAEMRRRLGDGDLDDVLKRFNLNIAEFRGLQADEQYFRLAESLGAIEDPALRAALAADVFGKGAKNIAATLRTDVRDGLQGVFVMSNDTADAIDSLGRMFDKGLLSAKAFGAELLANVTGLKQLQMVIDSLSAPELPTLPPSPSLGPGPGAPPMLTADDFKRIEKQLTQSAQAAIKINEQAARDAERMRQQQAKQATALRAFYNELGVREIENAEAAMQATEDRARAERQMWNEIGVERMNAEAAEIQRIDREQAAWRQYLNFIGERRMNTEAAAMQRTERDGQRTVTMLRELSSAAADLAQVTGETGGRVATLIGSLALAGQAGLTLDAGFKTLRKGGIANVIEGFAQMAAGAMTAAASLAQATDQAGRANRTMSGAAAGAAMGSAFGPWGTLIGAGVGALVGALRNPAFEDVMNRVGHDWGVEISEGLARGIADEAKKTFGGNRDAAALFNLDKIIGEGGGLTAENLDRMTGKLRDVFVMFETGAFTSAQATQVLDRNWAAFVEAGTDGNGRLSAGLREIIQLQQQLGVESKAIADFLKQQTATAITGTNAIIAAAPHAEWQRVGDAVRTAQQEVDQLTGSQDRLTRALTDQHRAAEGAKGELQDLGVIALSTYAAAVAAGQTHAEALRAAGPGLQQLSQAYTNLGLDVEDAGLKALLMQSNLQQRNPQLIAGVDGLSQSFVALSNIGALTGDTFKAMQRTGMQMYTRLQAETAALGGSTKDALVPMQGFLQEAQRQAELLGVPLDANTQMLIDQSRELGVWQDKGPTAMEQMTRATESLVRVMDDLVATLRGLPADADRAARGMSSAFGSVRPPSVVNAQPVGGFQPAGSSAFTSAAGPASAEVTNHLGVVVVVQQPGQTPEQTADAVVLQVRQAVRGNQHGLRAVIADAVRPD